jgi:PQQ-dependent dehydrogenase (methanol/ethanol family)
MKRLVPFAALFLTVLVYSLPAAAQPAQNVAPKAAAPKLAPVTDQMLQKPDPADWLTWRRTLDSWGYSPLNQINKRNVGKLRMVWTRGLEPGVQEGTPLVHNGVMFFPNPNDIIQAINAATGDLIWEHRRPLPDDIHKYFPAPTANRNIAIYGDKVIDTSEDDFVFGLDAATGVQAWQTKIADYREYSAQETSGPIIANGKIISGRGCEPRGEADACVITAHDAATGKELWRTRTIPRPGEPGSETWGDTPLSLRRHVGTWMVPSYDPQLNLIIIGTSVTSPAPKFQLAGNDKKYLYHNCTLALDADTGKIVWYYQHIVDHWDLDHPFERYLIDTVVAPDPKEVTWINPKIKPGERRRVVTGIPGKTGIVYTLDLKTGEFLWARPTTPQNVVSKIDGATGEVTVNPETTFSKGGQQRFVCPVSGGGKNWPAGAYSPLNNVMYQPLQNICGTIAPIADTVVPNSLYGIVTKAQLAPGFDKAGTVQAIDVSTGKILWKYEQRAVTYSLVATGGGLIFGGDAAGRFRALDQDTGKVLWEVNLGSPVSGYPITFSVNGKQYVAASTGGALGGARANALTPEIRPSLNSAIYVFALPDQE